MLFLYEILHKIGTWLIYLMYKKGGYFFSWKNFVLVSLTGASENNFDLNFSSWSIVVSKLPIPPGSSCGSGALTIVLAIFF